MGKQKVKIIRSNEPIGECRVIVIDKGEFGRCRGIAYGKIADSYVCEKHWDNIKNNFSDNL